MHWLITKIKVVVKYRKNEIVVFKKCRIEGYEWQILLFFYSAMETVFSSSFITLVGVVGILILKNAGQFILLYLNT